MKLQPIVLLFAVWGGMSLAHAENRIYYRTDPPGCAVEAGPLPSPKPAANAVLTETAPSATAPESTPPQDSATRQFCTDHHLTSFSYSNSLDLRNGPKEVSYEYCDWPREKMPLAVRNALEQVVRLNAEAARALHIELSELLPEGLKISLRPFALGPWGYSAWDKSLSITVFPDWPESPGDADHTINEALYLHELGHVIALGHSRTAQIVHELAMQPLFIETFSDTLAISLRGRVFSADPQVPECLQKVRWIGLDQSYRAQGGYFDNFFGLRRMHQCCSTHPGGGWSHPRIVQACSMIEKTYEQWVGTTHYDRKPLDLSPRQLEISPILDPHQIGIPVNSFLLDLSQRLGVPALDLYFTALREFDTDATRREYGCSALLVQGLVAPFLIRSFTPDQILDAIRARLAAEQKLVFDALYEKHRLDRYAVAAQQDAAYRATRGFWTLFASTPPETEQGRHFKAVLGDCSYDRARPACTVRPECALECGF
jgi:hypothetical protein